MTIDEAKELLPGKNLKKERRIKTTIDKAIRILERHRDICLSIGQFDDANSIQLGIEALEAVILCRKGVSANVYMLLPGETKD